ncbi:MAG: amidohydrolase family protein [Bryobacteraceae bacterium]|nr:amidohydrolase family protein [Bryobacteraceae bacterium]
MPSRRTFLLAALADAPPDSVEAHLHLFEPARFPYHPAATYRPPAEPLAPYLAFARAHGVRHAVIVHPEPYQDDHRYLEYCFTHEQPQGFFKGTCLFDPIDAATPGRIRELTRRWPGRIVALRIHAMNAPHEPFLASGPLKNRDLAHPAMRRTWAACADLGLAIQMHFVPHHAPAIATLARDVPVNVILDHLGRAGVEPGGWDAVLRLADLPRATLKFSGLGYSSKLPHPFPDLTANVGRLVRAFGPTRIVQGGLGPSPKLHREAMEQLAAFIPAPDRAAVRYGNAMKLYGFT